MVVLCGLGVQLKISMIKCLYEKDLNCNSIGIDYTQCKTIHDLHNSTFFNYNLRN